MNLESGTSETSLDREPVLGVRPLQGIAFPGSRSGRHMAVERVLQPCAPRVRSCVGEFGVHGKQDLCPRPRRRCMFTCVNTSSTDAERLKQVGTRIPAALYKEFKLACQIADVSVQTAINDAIRAWMKVHS